MSTRPTAIGEREAAIGALMRAARKRQRVGLRPLAEHLQCSINTIRWHEAGARMMRADMLSRAADFIGVPPAELIGGNQE